MTEEILLRLRKAQDDTVLGPFPLQTLQQYAQSALVGPQDMVDFVDDQWKPVSEVRELEMHYIITSKADGNSYGPTTRGTIREFLVSGELAADDTVEDTLTKEIVTVQDFFGTNVLFPTSQKNLIDEQPEQDDPLPMAETVLLPTHPIKADDSKSTEETNQDLVVGQELAKDLQIRQLQADLASLQTEYDNLLQKYRQLSEK